MVGGAKPRRKGDRFERQVKSFLEEQGFFCTRQPRSAFPDLIAIKFGNYFIECKIQKYISRTERDDLKRLVSNYGGTALIAYKSNKNKISFCDLDYNEVSRDL